MNSDQAKYISHRLEQCYSGTVYDALREKGIRNCVLPSEINPLIADRRLAGPVFTVGATVPKQVTMKPYLGGPVCSQRFPGARHS